MSSPGRPGARVRTAILLAFSCLLSSPPHAIGQSVSPLFARGYTVLPQPQEVVLEAGDGSFGADWRLDLDAAAANHGEVQQVLCEGLKDNFNLTLRQKHGGDKRLVLRIDPGSVPAGAALDKDRQAVTDEAYRLELGPRLIRIQANSAAGLFDGVETFLQLLRPVRGVLRFPTGSIRDWPDLHLRHIYWDDSHHLEKLDALKHILRQAAFFKINGVALKLDGHFLYQSAPAAAEPYALTPAQLQELTDYGLRYHVQVIPYLDAPAHLAFLLKHPEYSGLREFPDSNYEICVANPESYKLLQGMYRDLLRANVGVRYFYLSTDEPYYIGKAANSQCDEKRKAEQLGSPGKLLAQFVTETAGYLHSQGRDVIFWGEYPATPADIPSFPPYLIDGEAYGPAFDRAYREHGIRQMIYTSTAGEEKLFPLYFLQPSAKAQNAGEAGDTPRLEQIFKTISFSAARSDAQIAGSVTAGWGDEGAHPETFWLGYAASAAVAWHPATPQPAEIASSFYSLFYGPNVVAMDAVYRLMSSQAVVWENTWDTVNSTARKGIFGSSNAIYEPRRPAKDQALPLPPSPSTQLAYASQWGAENAGRLQLALKAMPSNDTLMAALHENLGMAGRNRYSLQVFLATAGIYRQNLQFIVGLEQMDRHLSAASRLAPRDPKAALAQVDAALDLAALLRNQRNCALHSAEQVWYQQWYPRVPEANGRRFLPVLDDVKDHLPDRTVDLSYLVYRERMLPFQKWINEIIGARNTFASAHHHALRETVLVWDSLGCSRGGASRQ